MRVPKIAFGLASIGFAVMGYQAWGQGQSDAAWAQGTELSERSVAKPVVEDAEVLAAASMNFTGKLVFSFTITIQSSIPSSSNIACEASAEIDDAGAGGQGPLITEAAAVAATRSGTTATCTVNVPYAWNLLNSSTDKVQLSYVISAPSSAFSGTSGLPARISTNIFGTIKVPANGATTTQTIKATI